jgi:hypothetical protein
MYYVFHYWYSLVYSNGYLFINGIVIVFILCSDPFILWVVLCSVFSLT